MDYAASHCKDTQFFLAAVESVSSHATNNRRMKQRLIDELLNHILHNIYKNKGYGTMDHITEIKKYGTCDIHRISFLKKIGARNVE